MPSLHDITYLIAVSLLNGDLLFPPAALPPSVTPSNGALEEEDTLGTVLDGLWRTPVSWRLFLWAVSSLGSLAFWKWYRRGRRSSDDGADDEESSSARRWWLLGCGFVPAKITPTQHGGLSGFASGALLSCAVYLILVEAMHLIGTGHEEEVEVVWRWGTAFLGGFLISPVLYLFEPGAVKLPAQPTAKVADESKVEEAESAGGA